MKILHRLLFVIVTLLSQAVATAQEIDETLSELERDPYRYIPQTLSRLDALEARYSQMSPSEQGRWLMLKGAVLIYREQFSLALDFLAQAENILKSPDDLATLYDYQAAAHIALRQFGAAFDSMQNSLSLIELLNEPRYRRTVFLRLANLYSTMSLDNEASIYAKRALVLTSPNEVDVICRVKWYQAMALLSQGANQAALSEFESTRQYCQQHSSSLIGTLALKGMAESEFNLGQYQQALVLLVNALKEAESSQALRVIHHLYALLARSYFALGQNVLAADYAQQLLALADKPANMADKYQAVNVMAALHAAQGQFDKAYALTLQGQQYEQQLFAELKMKEFAYQAFKFNADAQSREIQLLNKERESYIRQQIDKDSQHTNMLMFMTILIGCLVFLGILLAAGNVQKRKFMRMASLDTLTGILNRSAGQELGENLFVQVNARGEDFCVILFDLDQFKCINENFGHATGDWALKKIVDSLKTVMRSGDVFARIGGEEFAIFLPYACEAKGMEIAKVCRDRIAGIDSHLSGHQFNISASFGVSSRKADDLSLDPILHRADMALYAAKSSRENSILCYTEALKTKKKATPLPIYYAPV